MRKIIRNMMKARQGNNNIAEAWRQFQVSKYGPEQYVIMRNKNRKIVNMGKGRSHRVGTRFAFGNRGITEGNY